MYINKFRQTTLFMGDGRIFYDFLPPQSMFHFIGLLKV